jgi:hypothetical protein
MREKKEAKPEEGKEGRRAVGYLLAPHLRH